jgi:hypothetical protein
MSEDLRSLGFLQRDGLVEVFKRTRELSSIQQNLAIIVVSVALSANADIMSHIHILTLRDSRLRTP